MDLVFQGVLVLFVVGLHRFLLCPCTSPGICLPVNFSTLSQSLTPPQVLEGCAMASIMAYPKIKFLEKRHEIPFVVFNVLYDSATLREYMCDQF